MTQIGGMPGVIDIEDLLGWTYRVQLADLILGLGVDLWHAERAAESIEWRDHSADGVYALLQRLKLGVRVDGSGTRFCADVHGMRAMGVPWARRQAMYLAVRVGGWTVWG